MLSVSLRNRGSKTICSFLQSRIVWPASLFMIGTAEPFFRLGAIVFWLLGPQTGSPVGYPGFTLFIAPLLLSILVALALVPLSLSIVFLVNPANRILWATILIAWWVIEIDLFVPVFILSLLNPTGPYGTTPVGFTPIIGLVGAVWALLQKTQSTPSAP